MDVDGLGQAHVGLPEHLGNVGRSEPALLHRAKRCGVSQSVKVNFASFSSPSGTVSIEPGCKAASS